VNERWDGDRTGAGVSDGGAFAPPLRTLLDVRELVYALISTIAEPTTVVVETREDAVDIFDVTLATTPRQSTFPKGHGHLVRLRVHTD
jgi:hypothetical protein